MSIAVKRSLEKQGWAQLPVTREQSGTWSIKLWTLGKYAGLEDARIEKVIAKHEEEYYYYIERSADVLLETRLLPRRFVTISDSFYILGIAKFSDVITAKVVFSDDGGAVQEDVRNIKFKGRPLIIGTAWERVLAEEINGYHLSVSMPVSDRLVLDRSYLGYEGALRLVEDIYTLVLEDYQR